MKNHEWVNGKLLQTNKKYSQLKLKQKEKIHEWMYAAFRDSFRRTGKFPGKKEDDEILAVVMQKIEESEIWIPWYEVEKHYKGVKSRLNKRYKKEKARTLMQMLMYGKEASNRKQEIDRQHYTIPNQRPKDKHCGKI